MILIVTRYVLSPSQQGHAVTCFLEQKGEQRLRLETVDDT
jgi:hypothetical protein